MKNSTYMAVASDDTPRKTSPKAAGCFSNLFFSWAGSLLSLGHERRLDPDDMWPLEQENQCRTVSDVFEPKFNQSRSILYAIFASYWRNLALVALGHNDFDQRYFLACVGLLVGAKIIQALASTHSGLLNQLVMVRITSALQHLLFKKALHLSSKSRREKSAGEIANLFSSDLQWIINFAVSSNQVWLLPLQVVVTLILLYRLIGWASLLGSVAIAIVLVSNNYLAMWQKRILETLMKLKDDRMKSVNEVFSAMQIVKLIAWEDKFEAKIQSQRELELTQLWKLFALQAFQMGVLYIAPVAVTIASFAAYTLVMHETLTATKMFTSLALFALLRCPMTALPQVIASLMQAIVAVNRFMAFLNLDERDPSLVLTPETISPPLLAQYASENVHVRIENGSFGWTPETPAGASWNLTLHRGDFVRSPWRNGQLAGSVYVGGSVTYFSQQPWIQNASVRENILFGRPYDREKYRAVIDACALTKDLASFPAGDRTEIGQKGVNLSGGQKARVSLARACYSNADIFILDAPLAAVDAIVQNEIFTKCFLGLLRYKTVLLVTHSPEIIASPYINRSVEMVAGSLVVTERTPLSKDTLPLTVRPLRASSSDGSLESPKEADSPPPASFFPTNHLFLTPSASSPFPLHFNGENFTPIDELSNLPYDKDDDEQSAKKHVSASRVSAAVFQGYLDAIGGWSVVAFCIFLLSMWQILIISGDLWLSRWSSTTTTVSETTFLAQAPYYLTVYAVLAASGVAATMLRTYTILMSCLRASRRLFDGLTGALLRAPMRFFDTTPLGRLLNRFSNDMNTVDTQQPLLVSGGLAVIAMTLGLALVPLVVIYARIAAFYVHPARAVERVNKTIKSPMLNLISECIDGGAVIRAFGPKHIRRFLRIHHGNVDINNQAYVAAQVITQWFSLRVQLLSACLLLIIALSLLWLRETLSPGLVGLVFTYIFSILPFFELIMNLSVVLVRDVNEPPRVIAGAVAAAWPTSGDVEFDHVSFRYKPGDALVLKDVSIHVKSGESIGIVGRTGAGKSSFTMALFRMNNLASGVIRIDGVDIGTIGVQTLRSRLVIIPQSPVLFKGTLRSYLDPFDDFTDDSLWSSLGHVKLAERVARVDGKLESPVEENGENFSVGERQMLCMARALLRRARIVVLDEATAGIDHETDALLQQVVRTEFASSTVLTIAHRLDTVLDSDRIMVLDQGQLVQCNTPKALLAQGSGIFFELCREGGYLDKVVT
ncbi:unnamed protein product [Aphanomyces euteiches]